MGKRSRLSVRERICYSGGLIGGNICNLLVGFLLSYYTDTVLLNAAAVSTMFLVSRFLDAGSDLIMGNIVDRTNTRWGKARPWLLISAPLMLVGMVALFSVPLGASDGAKMVYAYATYIILNVFFYTMYNVSYFSLLARMSTDTSERTNTGIMATILSNVICSALSSVILPVITKYGWRNAAFIFGAACSVLILITFFGTKERVAVSLDAGKAEKINMKELLPIVLKNRYFYLIILLTAVAAILATNMNSSAIYYCNYILGNPNFISQILVVSQLPVLVSLLCTPFLLRKLQKRHVLIGGCILTILAQILLCNAGTNTTLILVATTIRTIGIGPVTGLLAGICGDIGDFCEWKSGKRVDGLVNSSRSFGMKIGGGVGLAVTGWILTFSGYDGALAEQGAEALKGIRFAYGGFNLILTIILLVISVLLMGYEKHMPELTSELDRRRQNAGSVQA